MSGDVPLASAELYDPKQRTMDRYGEPGRGPPRHTATLLTDGKVIVVGGNDLVGGVVPAAELYDPGSGS